MDGDGNVNVGMVAGNSNSGDGDGADGNNSGGSDDGDEDENDAIDMPRTCQKTDQFHAFDEMPPLSEFKMIRRLVIQQSTIEFDDDDWEDMTGFLADHHGITDLKGGDNIVSVRDLILANPVLKVAWTPALKQYFDNLEEMTRKGHTGGSYTEREWLMSGKIRSRKQSKVAFQIYETNR
eukprot:scaffold61668_cov69-Attheya_sp.AAC.2